MLQFLEYLTGIDQTQIFQIILSMICGGILGAEREIRKQPAGLRTIILITLGSCIFMIVGDVISTQIQWDNEQIRIDPGRLASYVIAGVGFLGAGPIIAKRNYVHGMTTAATIWVAAAVGLLIGIHEYNIAIFTTTLVTAVLFAFMPISQQLYNIGPWAELVITCDNSPLSARLLVSTLKHHEAKIISHNETQGQVSMKIKYKVYPRANIDFLKALRDIENIEIHGQLVDPKLI